MPTEIATEAVPALPDAQPFADRRRRAQSARSIWLGALLVAAVALATFGRDLAAEPHFVDESAYLSQTYYADLFLDGRRDDPAWLEHPALDLPPLPKYLFGGTLRALGMPRQPPAAAVLWYHDIHTRADTVPGSLVAARWWSVAFGTVACVALYGLGTLAFGPRAGLLAAFFLGLDADFRMHCRRAMSDAIVEGLVLSTAFLALWAWRATLEGRLKVPKVLLVAPALGALGGLAVLTKLTGGLALMIVAAFALLGLALGRFPIRRRLLFLSAAILAAPAAFATFVALNPTVTARPKRPGALVPAAESNQSIWERTKRIVEYRVLISRGQQEHPDFKKNLLDTPYEKARAVLIQGFGRYGPFGPPRASSIKKVDWPLDRPCLVWTPWVALGALYALRRGLRQYRDGKPPTAWAVLLQAWLALVVVTAYIPMAWDRYFIPIQAGSALLAAGVASAAIGGIGRWMRSDAYRRAAGLVFLTLLGSYAFFWHTRDWNVSSRLMLTYALVDRGTVRIDGLEDHTHDRAKYDGHYYSDKLPGYSFLAVPVYATAKALLHLPDHPLGRKGPEIPRWPADYWTTLGTSGVLTALTGSLLVFLARSLGCGPRRAALVGLSYGLATPAFAYATLAYGHQATAFALLASFALLQTLERRRPRPRAALAGFLAALAATIELQVGPISAIFGLYLLILWMSGRVRFASVAAFGLGALVPTLGMLAYNAVAFGSPFDMGYFHHDTAIFARVHSAANPLGLRRPGWSLVPELLWGRRRGLLWFAPIVALALPGWLVLVAKRRWGVAVVSLATCLAVFLVNLSYPEWTGGLATGPRLLVPLLPFAMLPVAALLGVRVGATFFTVLATALTLWGATVMLLCQGVGARLDPNYVDPVFNVALPLWRGDPLPSDPRHDRSLYRLIPPDPPGPRPWYGDRFDRTLVSWTWPVVSQLPPARRWTQFAPLVAFQALMGALVMMGGRRGSNRRRRRFRRGKKI
ncbi:MAG TPA: hypothetical protein VG406_14420 [Isosphaeraceae bacterium]|nr:hypothetical protein [Isosphaeraceae bacterium]